MNEQQDEQTDRLLQAWLDGELSEEQRAQAESLLASNEEHRQRVEAYEKIGASLRRTRGLERVEPSADKFWNRLRPQLSRPSAPPWWRVLWLRPAYSLALAGAAAAVILVALWVGTLKELPIPQPAATLASEPGCLVDFIETEVEDATLVAYHSEQDDLTVLWLFTDNDEGATGAHSSTERQSG